MAITFPYSGQANNSATLSFTTSSDVLSTDVIWCMVGINLTGNTITPPSGFTELTLTGGNNASTLSQIRIYYNLSPAASTVYNATHGGAGRSSLVWVQVRGSDNTSLANHVNTSVGGSKAATETPVSDSITTTNATTTLLGFVGFRAFPVNGVAPGTGYTEIVDGVGVDGSTNIRQEMAYRDVTSTGSYTYTATLNPADGEPTIIGIIALNPAAGGGGTQNVTANGVGSGESVGATNVVPAVGASAIASAEQLGATQVSATYTINAAGIVTSERLGTITRSTTYTMSPKGIVSTERLGSTTTSATYTISPKGIATSERSGASTVSPGSVTISPAGIVSNEAFGNPLIQNITQITPAGIVTNEQLGAAQIQPGNVTINANGITTSEASGVSLVILAQSVNANGIATLAALGTPTIAVGPATINAFGIGSSESVGNAQLGVSVTPAGIPSNESLGSPTITIAAAGISAGNITSGEQLGSPTITATITIAVNGIRTEERFGATTLSSISTISAAGIRSTEKLGSPTISVGASTINAAGILSAAGLGSPMINDIPLIPPTPDTLIRVRIGQTILKNDTGRSTIRINDSETVIVI